MTTTTLAGARTTHRPEQTPDGETEAAGSIVAAGSDDSATCRRCGKPLRSELSRRAGYGATCAQRSAADWQQLELPLDVEVGR